MMRGLRCRIGVCGRVLGQGVCGDGTSVMCVVQVLGLSLCGEGQV